MFFCCSLLRQASGGRWWARQKARRRWVRFGIVFVRVFGQAAGDSITGIPYETHSLFVRIDGGGDARQGYHPG